MDEVMNKIIFDYLHDNDMKAFTKRVNIRYWEKKAEEDLEGI